MDHFRLMNIAFNWAKIYIINYLTYLLILAAHWATNKRHKFEYDNETHYIKLSSQSLEALLYIYEEDLNVSLSEKIDDEYMVAYRDKYLKKNNLRNLQILTNNEIITISRS